MAKHSEPFDIGPIDSRLYDNNRSKLDKPELNRPRKKRLLFLSVFLFCAAAGLTWTYTRPAIYQSHADILLTANNTNETTNIDSLIKHQVAIESQILKGREILTALREAISAKKSPKGTMPSNIARLKEMLRVIPVEQSGIITLQAEGPDQTILPDIINTWLDLYLGQHVTTQKTDSTTASESLRHQLRELEDKISVKRTALKAFREKHDIVSMEREENQTLSKLNGLNAALNKTSEKRVLAEANLAAIKAAIAEGKWAGKYKKTPELAKLEDQAEEQRETYRTLEQRYTAKFLELDKDARAASNNLTLIEEKIQQAYEENRKEAVEEAAQAIASARLAEAELRKELAAYKKKVSQFSTKFSEHESLQEELLQIETLYRNIKEQLVAMEIKSSPETLQIKIMERAFAPERPVRPKYMRDAGISLAVSCLLGIFAVLCYELFTHPAKQPTTGSGPITYNQIFPNALPYIQESDGNGQTDTSLPALAQPFPRELSETEITALIDAADAAGKLPVLAILSGLSAEETVLLKWQDVQIDTGEIHVPSMPPRTLSIPAFFRTVLEQIMADPTNAQTHPIQDESGRPLQTDALETIIKSCAQKAALFQPTEITATVLRHTYIAYLVRQGANLSDIASRAGQIPHAFQAAYEIMSPPGPDVPPENVNWVYPAMETARKNSAS